MWDESLSVSPLSFSINFFGKLVAVAHGPSMFTNWALKLFFHYNSHDRCKGCLFLNSSFIQLWMTLPYFTHLFFPLIVHLNFCVGCSVAVTLCLFYWPKSGLIYDWHRDMVRSESNTNWLDHQVLLFFISFGRVPDCGGCGIRVFV